MVLKTALLVIDIQNDFLPGGSLAVKDGDKIIPGVLNLLNFYKWDAVAFSQDWHPKDHISFASNHANVKPFEKIEFQSTKDQNYYSKEFVWPDHCVQHHHGADFPDSLIEAYKNIDVPKTIVQKGSLHDRDYYSAFNDIWYDDKTELDAFLKSNDIEQVFIVGLAYDVCVKYTSESSSKIGYKTFVIKPLSKAVNPNNLKETDEYLINNGTGIIEELNDKILNRLKKGEQ
ncbi:hypothetical protein WICMUC_000331 [Wickerhamomyces mucosus]|uniref:nicotinamidase n=1 Tax=Wickerhamomyces mucosus TaxID=1378264 RepID=A0A9P8PZI2_9ASCO|nr:hypothetical protein WICMUC_000331 [Wickerhamomyces mucosus]